jgi:Uncharacterised nucleotidyltransferase
MFDSIRKKLDRDIPQEARLVLRCAHAHPDIDPARHMRDLITKDMDWSFLKTIAARHQIVPLVYHNLDKLTSVYPDRVPNQVMQDLKELVDICTTHNKQNLNELSGILKQLHANGIATISFKGVTFALRMYGSLNLRQCGDIDLLVQRKDFLRAKDILIRSGYDHTYFGHHEVATAQAQLTRNTDRVSSVDLHYGITPYCYPVMREALKGSTLERKNWNGRVTNLTHWMFYLDCDPLWERAESTTIEGMNFKHFSVEDELLVAIIQGIKESWHTMRRVCDIAEIIRSKPEMNWDFISKQVREMRFEKKAMLGFRLAHELLDTPLGAPILKNLAASHIVSMLALETRQRLFSTSEPQDRGFFRLWSHYLSMDTFHDRYRFLIYVYRTLRVPGQWRTTLSNLSGFINTVAVQSICAVAIFLQERQSPRVQSVNGLRDPS